MADAPANASADLGIFSHAGEQAAKDRASGYDPAKFVKEHDGILSQLKGLVERHFGAGQPQGK